jgi:hypothetical protein
MAGSASTVPIATATPVAANSSLSDSQDSSGLHNEVSVDAPFTTQLQPTNFYPHLHPTPLNAHCCSCLACGRSVYASSLSSGSNDPCSFCDLSIMSTECNLCDLCL